MYGGLRRDEFERGGREEERGGVSKVRRGQEGAHSLVKAVFIL